ncbi:gamma-glutamyltransferase [Alkalicoccus urumqiensis]|uniref:Gamma-glutamyltransferase n=2 Tax=Alkalicoccus urumqiensis TaxID=1548213 RepID=A0A2P6MGR2_ALKUR|nr:gamma-glutamyltransferase [Alkalicoccus urumqiensis]
MYTPTAEHYPYGSKRTVTYGKNGMVATSQPMAAQAGLDMLKQGGNAVDAAIATAAALTVVEPTSNGIGSDAFAIVWIKDKLYGLNGSGPAPASISIEKVKEKDGEEMPVFGLTPVTVPGTPASWAALSKRFGKLPFEKLMEPAVRYARDGFPVSPVLASFWKRGAEAFRSRFKGEVFDEWFRVFTPDGKAPEAGELWRSPDHADTLEEIGKTGARSFYEGALADKMDACSKKYDGFIRREDLEGFEPEWVDPVSVSYKGYDVYEIPPNGQGMIALMGLNMLRNDAFTSRESDHTWHYQIEAMKRAFADGEKQITERSDMNVSVESLLDPSYADSRREGIKETAQEPEAGDPSASGTVYLACADSEGNMVSFIQSNYMGFGSGVVVPGTGIALQNRGHNFHMDPDHVNALRPGKRPYHTIIPGFLMKDGSAVGPFGVMGGFMQPQGHMQVIMNTLDFGLNPQQALDAPRWQWTGGKNVLLEQAVPNALVQQLAARGHHVSVTHDSGSFGRGQIIWRNPETGVLAGGTEARTDGTIAAY